MLNNLGASVTFLTSQVETLTSAPAGRSATPSPPATSTLEASLKDLSSHVAALSSHCATQVGHPLPQAPPPPAPAVRNKPAQQKKKLATRLSSRTGAAPESPFLFEGNWYGNPDTYAKRPPTLTTSWCPFRLSSSPLRGSQTLLQAIPNHLTFAYLSPLASQSLIPCIPKNRPGHMFPGRVVRARKTPLQHKSLCQSRVVSPKDPHGSQLLNIIFLLRAPRHPSRTIRLS